MKNLSRYLTESLSNVDIDAVMNFVMKHYKARSWQECIDKQQFGDCRKLCKLIGRKFPGLFNNMYDCNIDYSKIAIAKLNELGDTDDMFGNHYLLEKDGVLYDFGKGTNTIKGIYLITQDDKMTDKYTITISKAEENCITEKIRRTL